MSISGSRKVAGYDTGCDFRASSGEITPGVLVSVVIVNWNGRHFLEACLNAVAAQDGVGAETILVDNASTDGSVAFVRERFPWVRVVALPENRGFAGGNNAGVREARGRSSLC